jgi:hypothetical protein
MEEPDDMARRQQHAAAVVRNAPKVLGILLIIFSAVYLMYSLFQATSTLMGQAFTGLIPKFAALAGEETGLNKADWARLGEQLAIIYRVQSYEKFLTAAISGLGLAAGISLVQYSSAAIRLGFWWAVLALGSLILEFIVFATVIRPVIQEVAGFIGHATRGAAPAAALVKGLSSASFMSLFMTNLMMAAYPVIILIYMLNKNVQEACGAKSPIGSTS